ncbi:DUF427 domain-containing protein [Geodermatophilus sp. DSM 44513]|uniref:DUF427 domain-containing protein n=1 Tax=Geodermatophilus sp. DSM 44513 TaxID=1528104 RepID=UPI0012861897|nr:DUF427 domain-containing protein [Geodermatophilus sp. DSM 44513]WNV77633.1 DUF427 domain-containing protein [Geodermatophilus sp. DSM 44513]
MSLTLGTGPLARPSAGQLNADLWSVAPAHALFLHPVQERIRGILGGETVVDTTGAVMLHETGLLPRWYLPEAHVAPGVLEPSDTRTTCPFKGEAVYWHLAVDGRRVADAAWSYPDPVEGCPPLAGLVSFPFEALDTWLVEDDVQIGHPRDPFHRVDVRRSSRHVVVRVGGQVVAETGSPFAVVETGLPVRWYVPGSDVRPGVLEPSATTTVCAYKGVATYEHVVVDGHRYDDVVWCYREPLPEALPIAGHRSFHGDGVEVAVTT